MRKQRNLVEKAFQEMSENTKTVVVQRLYAALSEAGVERQAAGRVLAIVSAAVDEVYGRSSKHFDKLLDTLVTAVQEDKPSNSKSGKK